MKQLLAVMAFCSIFFLGHADVVFNASNSIKESPEQQEELFDPDTVNTILGRVVTVNTTITPLHKYYGVRIDFRSDHGDMEVYLGPHWFLQRIGLTVSPGDHLEVTGSTITGGERPVIVAAEVRKNQIIYKLRDKYNGAPVWTKR